MPGPPPTPSVIKLLRGNPGKRAIRSEPKPEIPQTPPEAPAFLAGHARDEWKRVAPELHRLRLLTSIDVAPLAAYCAAYGRWRTAEELLNEVRDELHAGLLVAGSSRAVPNPLVKISRDAAEAMVRFAGEFGMTPVARSRISAGVGYEPPSKFDGLLG